LIPINCSSWLKEANWLRNVALSIGWVGSWFWICATSNCRKVDSSPSALVLATAAAVDVEVDDVELGNGMAAELIAVSPY
jgi:hypothetical protein